MDSSPIPQVVRTYLDQLEATLSGVREDVRHDIVAGIAEELRGLSAADAAVRIEALGDPAFIAAEARAEDAASATAEPGAAAPKPTPAASGDARWYVVLAALLVAFGGVVIPVIGWIVGIALVWLSRTWNAWEKWVATLTAIVAVAAAGVLNLVFEAGGVGVWNAILLAILVNLVVGVWLLWRAQGRTIRER